MRAITRECGRRTSGSAAGDGKRSFRGDAADARGRLPSIACCQAVAGDREAGVEGPGDARPGNAMASD